MQPQLQTVLLSIVGNDFQLFGLTSMLGHQYPNWNAEPFRGRFALRKQGHVERGMVGQHRVHFGVMSGRWARDIEGRLDRRMRCRGQTPVQRDVKDELKVQVDHIERR